MSVAESMGVVVYRCRRCGTLTGEEQDEYGKPIPYPPPTVGCKCWAGPHWQRGTWVPETEAALAEREKP